MRLGRGAKAVNLALFPPAADLMGRLPVVVVVAAIRYGTHLREADAALDVYAGLAPKPRLALVSVNLTARKPGKQTAQSNPYLCKWIRKRKLAPDLAVAIAGRLDYPRYRWFDRLAIRAIMTLTGGETDPTTQVEYTDWNAVDAFADQIARLAAPPRHEVGAEKTSSC